jgi:thiamine-phosphate pyrophosphorylase
LYLVCPHDPSGSAHLMMQALEAADIAAVLLRPPDASEAGQIDHIRALGPAVQSRGAALLLDGNPHLAAASGADGAHLHGPDALKAALPHLKPERIAGCGGLASRHDAMVAGEAGADYVMFGEPGVDGGRPSFTAVWERIVWWADLFEIPCVGFAGTLDEVEPLALAGADFVAIGECVFSDSRGCAAAVAEAARRLEAAEAAA